MVLILRCRRLEVARAEGERISLSSPYRIKAPLNLRAQPQFLRPASPKSRLTTPTSSTSLVPTSRLKIILQTCHYWAKSSPRPSVRSIRSMTELQAPRSSYTAANAVHSGANGSFLYRWWVPKLSHTCRSSFPYQIDGCGWWWSSWASGQENGVASAITGQDWELWGITCVKVRGIDTDRFFSQVSLCFTASAPSPTSLQTVRILHPFLLLRSCPVHGFLLLGITPRPHCSNSVFHQHIPDHPYPR